MYMKIYVSFPFFFYLKFFPVVLSRSYVLSCCVSYVLELVCVMCRITSVLCAGAGLCYVLVLACVTTGFSLAGL